MPFRNSQKPRRQDLTPIKDPYTIAPLDIYQGEGDAPEEQRRQNYNKIEAYWKQKKEEEIRNQGGNCLIS